MKIRNVTLITLLVCMFCPSVGAMQTNSMLLPKLLPSRIPTFPVEYLKFAHTLINRVQTNQVNWITALTKIENEIINPLTKFNGQYITLSPTNVKDLVAACFAFKILTGVRIRSPNFCDMQYVQVCKFLMTYEIITQKEIEQGGWDSCESGALFKAVESGNIIHVIRVIAAGVDVHATINNPAEEYHGWTALHLAAYKGNTSIIQALVATVLPEQRVTFFNTTINNPRQWYHGWTALHLAVEKNHVGATQALIKAGAQVPANLIQRLQQMGINVPENQIVR